MSDHLGILDPISTLTCTPFHTEPAGRSCAPSLLLHSSLFSERTAQQGNLSSPTVAFPLGDLRPNATLNTLSSRITRDPNLHTTSPLSSPRLAVVVPRSRHLASDAASPQLVASYTSVMELIHQGVDTKKQREHHEDDAWPEEDHETE